MSEEGNDKVQMAVLEQRVKFLEKIVYTVIAFVALQLIGLFILWAKQVIDK